MALKRIGLKIDILNDKNKGKDLRLIVVTMPAGISYFEYSIIKSMLIDTGLVEYIDEGVDNSGFTFVILQIKQGEDKLEAVSFLTLAVKYALPSINAYNKSMHKMLDEKDKFYGNIFIGEDGSLN